MGLRIAGDALLGIDPIKSAIKQTAKEIGPLAEAMYSIASMTTLLPESIRQNNPLFFLSTVGMEQSSAILKYANSFFDANEVPNQQDSTDGVKTIADLLEIDSKDVKKLEIEEKLKFKIDQPEATLPPRFGLAAPIPEGLGNQFSYASPDFGNRISPFVQSILAPPLFRNPPGSSGQPELGRQAQLAYENYLQDVSSPYAVR